jgi:putative ABC transport system permease protein
LLGSIAAISLLVGGIGIMNIMLVSVTERTREIGLRKAVGAKRVDILIQFLVEAMTLSVIGGLVGVAAGIGGAQLITPLLGNTRALVTAQSVILALVVSLGIGIFFGFYPANRAARLHPIDALRYE